MGGLAGTGFRGYGHCIGYLVLPFCYRFFSRAFGVHLFFSIYQYHILVLFLNAGLGSLLSLSCASRASSLSKRKELWSSCVASLKSLQRSTTSLFYPFCITLNYRICAYFSKSRSKLHLEAQQS
jgi:hypothetical protein